MASPPDSGRWSDLNARMASGTVMVGIGSVAIVAGGVWFQMLAVFASAVMVWELWTMIEPEHPGTGVVLTALVASVMSGQMVTEQDWGFLLFLVVPLIGVLMLRRERITFFIYALAIQIAGWGLVGFRQDYGFTWLMWMILVVVATDLAGYFAGRAIGGPKFWPAISPKKTWAGTAAGWISAGLVGLLFDLFFAQVSFVIVPISMLLSFASQMGDIAESALKRRMNVKDSSHLIPGHGGLFDRFDALLGASLFMLAIYFLFGNPGVAF
ncbi:MAG: CDP-archaeol synthase [Rhodobacterales bacterium]|jgi:phosphatidate cytidylyltransferase|nr:CDP-archaeol synthase [Rhodobacterales bacterium]